MKAQNRVLKEIAADFGLEECDASRLAEDRPRVLAWIAAFIVEDMTPPDVLLEAIERSNVQRNKEALLKKDDRKYRWTMIQAATFVAHFYRVNENCTALEACKKAADWVNKNHNRQCEGVESDKQYLERIANDPDYDPESSAVVECEADLAPASMFRLVEALHGKPERVDLLTSGPVYKAYKELRRKYGVPLEDDFRQIVGRDVLAPIGVNLRPTDNDSALQRQKARGLAKRNARSAAQMRKFVSKLLHKSSNKTERI